MSGVKLEKDTKKPSRRKLPKKGSEDYVKIRNEDAKRRRQKRAAAHKCPYCDFRAPFPNKIRIHLTTNHTKGRFTCEQCSEVFNNQSEKRKHVTQKHRIEYRCDICNFSAARRLFLQRHIEKAHTQGMKCTIPGCTATLHKRQLKKHLAESHSAVKDVSIKMSASSIQACTLCDFTAFTFEEIEKHFQSVHSNEISCPFVDCNAIIIVPELAAHIKEGHQEENATLTPKIEMLANKTYSYKIENDTLEENLDDSMRYDPEDFLQESENDITLDEECSSLLNDLLDSNDNSADFNCILCKGSFKNLSVLKRHIRSVHDKVYKVDRREKKHVCSFEGCDKSFTTASLLNDHLNVHNNVTPYTCATCDQKFHARARFAVHLSKYHQMSIKAYDAIQRDLPI